MTRPPAAQIAQISEINQPIENSALERHVTDAAQIAQIAPISPGWRHLAQSFCALGATEEQLAELFSVSPEIIAGWMAEIPDFADAVCRGRNLADAHVANSFYRLAVGYSHTVERVLQGRDGPVTVSYLKRYPPRSKACMDWLVNRHPDKWGPAAFKRKLQEAEDARDAAARRPPLLSNEALAALVLACEEESSVRQPEHNQTPQEAVAAPARIDAAAEEVGRSTEPAPPIGGPIATFAGPRHVEALRHFERIADDNARRSATGDSDRRADAFALVPA
jgi:hypothetical protein